MAASTSRRLRCAIYTRKSTEEGLDQAFNSLDAQREACAAYILSQRHEGWQLVPDLYDDGGFTGGNMDRPGLKQLLTDVRAGRVDVVVVYKVDRLTRSLADFAKIVDVLDAAGASFVSVTQAFNTTNSMGRLTLNVLLSFAQFEREVIAERIRDKVAASKARGMWMGGNLPLGYAAVDKKLVLVPDEAETVRHIMRQYLASANVLDLAEKLRRQGIVSKLRVGRNGQLKGGVPFNRGALHHLLSNRTYVGEVVHRGKIYPGEHEAIVDRELFDAAQAKLAARTNAPLEPGRRGTVSLLAGVIRDDVGRPMSPIHTRNHGKRYRYYASHRGDGSKEPALRLPAGALDHAVRTSMQSFLADAQRVSKLNVDPAQHGNLIASFGALASSLDGIAIADLRKLLQQAQLRVTVSREAVKAEFDLAPLAAWVGVNLEENAVIALSIAASQARWGHEPRLRLDPPAGAPANDPNLVQLIARGFVARDQLLEMSEDEVQAMPSTQLRHLERIARLAYLAPDIITTILDGRQPRQVTARFLSRLGALPLAWSDQRKMLGFSSD
ncbi:recombinase family protein [Novosphingobium tardum]|uniref:Recombinase family protein n=1 Tax=Novosphingobium tardum TaxID=1538021 RepID=A0ABV8RJN5_9SPHN